MQRTLVLTALVLQGWVTLWRAVEGGMSGNDWLLRLWPLAGFGLLMLAFKAPDPWDMDSSGGFFELEPLDLARWGWVVGTAAVSTAVALAGDWWRRDRRTPPPGPLP